MYVDPLDLLLGRVQVIRCYVSARLSSMNAGVDGRLLRRSTSHPQRVWRMTPLSASHNRAADLRSVLSTLRQIECRAADDS